MGWEVGRKQPNRATGSREGREGWAGLGWRSTDPNDAVLQARAAEGPFGPSYRWSHAQLQFHRRFSEPIAALQSSLIRVFLLLLLAHLPKRERPQSPFSFLPFYFPFPPLPCLVVESVSSCFPCVCVACACLWCQGQQLSFKLNSPARMPARPSVCKGEKNPVLPA